MVPCAARLVGASLLGMLDRDQQRFQLQHALLREELRDLAPLGELLQVAGK